MFLSFVFSSFLFFFNDTSTTEIYTLSLHDALPISVVAFGPDEVELAPQLLAGEEQGKLSAPERLGGIAFDAPRSEEHTSELQSRFDLVCRLLLEKKKKKKKRMASNEKLHTV